MGHALSDHPTKHFLPTGELADDISGRKNPFTKWILNHAGPGDAICYPHLLRGFHILLALDALADHYKLNVAILLGHQTCGFKEVRDSLLRNYPAYLSNNRAI